MYAESVYSSDRVYVMYLASMVKVCAKAVVCNVWSVSIGSASCAECFTRETKKSVHFA